MKQLFYFLPSLLIVCLSCNNSSRVHKSGIEMPEEKLAWHLGAQAYTFKNFTFAQALDKIDSCGLKYVEAFPKQEIGNGIKGSMNYTMDASTRKQIKILLQQKGIKMLGFGVVKAKGAEDWRRVFEFCKDMGVLTITCEPEKADVAAISSLCDEFNINAAIHNHPKPSPYWHPDSVLAVIKGQSSRFGVCADIGHWVRSGLDPVECLQKLNGHIKHLHFKDLNELNNRKAHDVIWGTGVCNIPAVIQELKRQQFKGMISVEYEYNWDNNVPDVIASVNYFRAKVK